ncbi:hypothetical protein EV193_11222 [Herbihabitans rhizosphaerae]|uniref:DUF946 family protein n=1 Tax=Herbihabitans rhizosphaerae TaxID=1872711 RepID=A0A4V2ERL7_9PSEU|nr:hypothetical protein [Herbihabitans rhizosphaerae]RZS32389.1 hypothetical protein EV193_11222 [Herbihabitans rhizosphaerae]
MIENGARVAAVALLLVSVGACSAEDTPSPSTSTAGTPVVETPVVDPVRQVVDRFGPLVHLASGERFEPTTAEQFIGNSVLMFSPGADCPDPVVADSVDAARLSAGYVGVEPADKCSGEKKTWRSNTPSRPKDRDAVGFYLDIAENARGGTGPAAPAYVQFKDRSYVMYWFLYAYNQQPVGAVGQFFDHEGDWERVAVLLDGDNNPTDVVYFGHGGKCRTTWSQAPKEGDHPVVYSAKGTHASYPDEGIHRVGIDRTSAGKPWRTWENLRMVDDQPWRDYGGGWGNVGQGAHATGPEGPHRNRNVDSVRDTEPCGVNDVPAQFVGDWKSLGLVNQPSADTKYSAELTIRAGTAEGTPIGSSYYPGLECRGDLYLVASTNDELARDRLQVREKITQEPLHQCVDEVDINLTIDRDQIDYDVLRGAPGPTTAILQRK